MATMTQLLRKPRVSQPRRSSAPALRKNPQRRVVCIRLFVTNPRKPNSAKRKVARVRFPTKYWKRKEHNITIAIPGGLHNLQKFSKLIIQGGNPRDIPACRYKAMMGKLDLPVWPNRRTHRSKYCVKKPPHEFLKYRSGRLVLEVD